MADKCVFDMSMDDKPMQVLVANPDYTGAEYVDPLPGKHEVVPCSVDILVSMHFVANLKAQNAIGNRQIEWHERFDPARWWMASTLVEVGEPALKSRANLINKE